MVEVEATHVSTTEVDGIYKLVPYTERRNKWGVTTALGYSSYEPVYYEPNFLAVDFVDIYSTPEMPLIELQISIKRNMNFGSFGGELSVGIYQNDSDSPELVDSSLQLIPVRLGAVLSLDTLSSEPMFVPYVSGGLYTMLYRESMEGNSHSGNTQVAPYMTAGVNILLDWLDRRAARTSYQESGIQSTYAYAQAYKLIESGDASDGDFSNDVSWGAGVRVEF